MQAKPWMEFFPIWEVKGQLNTLIEEWVHVAAYQKTLPSKAFPSESRPDTGVCTLLFLCWSVCVCVCVYNVQSCCACVYILVIPLRVFLTLAITRIQKRLHKRQSHVPTPKFHYCAPPFVLLSADDLLSSEALINVVHSDFEYLNGQAM